jgi:hypothetical protein
MPAIASTRWRAGALVTTREGYGEGTLSARRAPGPKKSTYRPWLARRAARPR